jgi:uncharacterized protein (TIGR02145 family)
MKRNKTNWIYGFLAGAVLLLSPDILTAQYVVGGTIPAPSAVLDIQGTNGGLLLPRLSTAERNSITNPAWGLMIINTSTLCLEINIGTPALPQWTALECRTGALASFNCAGASVTGSLVSGQVASGVSFSVPYTGGNGGIHSGQTVSSTGITGLTATLAAGNFSEGAGTLTYTVSGTPSAGGTATFALSIGVQSCSLNATVLCRAKVDATNYKNFLCHNLGAANTSANPFTPSWEINGGYWQWGRLDQAAAGPAGPGAGQTNEAAVSGWNTTNAPNGSWSVASKTANDPCPAGYRIPTKAQWDGVRFNNTLTNVGTWTSSSTNYSSGKQAGTALFLPAAGSRSSSNGALSSRGSVGYYWSSTENGTSNAGNLNFNSSGAYTSNNLRAFGYTVRCIAE